MFDFLNKKYRNPSELASYQDSILAKQGINVVDIDKYIAELNKYNVLFVGLLGFNAISENNLFVRQNLILASLYYLKSDSTKCREHKTKADNAFVNLRSNWFYLEGYSYFLYVKMAYEFYFRYVPQFAFGSVDMNTIHTMISFYGKISGPDGKLLLTDTDPGHTIPNHDRIGFSNQLYSAYYLNNQTSFVFINHNTHINRLSKNLHVNYEFGHFCVFHDGSWLVMHPFYPGYDTKMNSPIKHSWNNNIIVDSINTNEPYWRYLPSKPDLKHSKNGNVHNFQIGKNITRKIEILNNGIFVTDNGGEYSSFNLSNDCKFNYTGKATEREGYHAVERGKVVEHRRLRLAGENRIFFIEFN